MNKSCIKDQTKRSRMIRWLNGTCNYSNDIYKDPGYSDSYKSYFNIRDDNHIIYNDNDIDDKINMDYDDDSIDEFTDYVPIDIPQEEINMKTKDYSEKEKEQIIDILTRKNIVIPPGSNQSNANFLYKFLKNFVHNYSYHIPRIPNHNKQYVGEYEYLNMDIDKESLYMFMFENS